MLFYHDAEARTPVHPRHSETLSLLPKRVTCHWMLLWHSHSLEPQFYLGKHSQRLSVWGLALRTSEGLP